jgi:hypothetical protein
MPPKKSAPARIERVDYLHDEGYDLPTGGDTRAALEIERITLPMTLPPSRLYTDSRISSKDSIRRALPHVPGNTCYRNSALAAVFNVSPFLNFIDSCVQADAAKTPMIKELQSLGRIFRNADNDAEDVRSVKLTKGMATVWDRLNTDPPPSSKGTGMELTQPWGAYCTTVGMEIKPTGQEIQKTSDMEDSVEFLNYLFQRLMCCELKPFADDTNMW